MSYTILFLGAGVLVVAVVLWVVLVPSLGGKPTDSVDSGVGGSGDGD